MRTRMIATLAAASLVGTGMVAATPASARTVVSVGFGFGRPAYRPYYGPRYYYPAPYYYGRPVGYFPRPYYRPAYPVRYRYRYSGWHRW